MVYLTKEEERMLNGEYGPAMQEAMSILVKIAEAYDAKRMVQAKSAHVAAGLFLEEIEWYERLLQGGEVRVLHHQASLGNRLRPL